MAGASQKSVADYREQVLCPDLAIQLQMTISEIVHVYLLIDEWDGRQHASMKCFPLLYAPLVLRRKAPHTLLLCIVSLHAVQLCWIGIECRVAAVCISCSAVVCGL